MARIRTIKPEFWTSPGVVRLSPHARLIFIGSWNFADDFGLLPDDPERLLLQVLPKDDVDPFRLVDELCESGHYVRVVAPSGDRLLSIPTFNVHQKIDSRTKGRWGDPAEWAGSDPSHLTPPGPADSRPVPPSESEGNGMELSSSSVLTTAAPVDNSMKADQVASAVCQMRLGRQSGVRNPDAWKRTCDKNLRADFAWWERLERLCAEFPTAPVEMLASAAEGDVSPNLNHYRTAAS